MTMVACSHAAAARRSRISAAGSYRKSGRTSTSMSMLRTQLTYRSQMRHICTSGARSPHGGNATAARQMAIELTSSPLARSRHSPRTRASTHAPHLASASSASSGSALGSLSPTADASPCSPGGGATSSSGSAPVMTRGAIMA